MTYHEPGTTVATDKFGLPKLPSYSDTGKSESDNRDHSRAPISTGGTITGKSFQTDAVDPRIVIDSTGLTAHRTDGTQSVRIDVAAGTITLEAGSSSSPGLVFTNTGSIVARVYDDTGLVYNASALTQESIGDITIIATPTLNAGLGGQFSEITLSSAVGSVGMGVQNAAATQNAGIAITATPVGRVSLQTTGIEAVDVVSGCIITSQQSLQRHLINVLPAFTCTFGIRFVPAAGGAANDAGVAVQYRQVRGDNNGNVVTPGAFTLTTVIQNTNQTAASITVVRGESAFLTVQPTAAGTCIYEVAATAS